MNADQALEKIRVDLAWEGPNGSKMRTICLPRGGAEALFAFAHPETPIEYIDAIMRLATKLTREEILRAADQLKIKTEERAADGKR